MMKKQADDPVGLALADDLVFRLFQMHVFGVREDFVGLRRGQACSRMKEAIWDNRAAATSRIGIAGPPLAGHGPLESSGRFALHGHWRWWLGKISYERLVELCRQEPHELETRLRAATAEAIRSIMSIQGASAAQLPRAFGDIEHPLEPLPLLNWQNTDYGGDGGFERTTKGAVSSLRRPTLQSVKSYPPEVPEIDITKLNFYKHPLQGTVVSSLPAYRRIGPIAQRNEGAQIICAMPAATWRQLYCQDARNLVMRCITHACGQ